MTGFATELYNKSISKSKISSHLDTIKRKALENAEKGEFDMYYPINKEDIGWKDLYSLRNILKREGFRLADHAESNYKYGITMYWD